MDWITGTAGVLLALVMMLPNILVPEYITTAYLGGTALVVLPLVATDTAARLSRGAKPPTLPSSPRRKAHLLAAAIVIAGLVGDGVFAGPPFHPGAAAASRSIAASSKDR